MGWSPCSNLHEDSVALSGEAERTVLDQEVKHHLDTCEVLELAVIPNSDDGQLGAQKHRITFETEQTTAIGSF